MSKLGLETSSTELQRLQMLLEISQRAAALYTLDEVLEALVEAASAATGADRGTLFLNDNESGELYSRVAQGGLTREIRILNTHGLAGACYQSESPIMVADAYGDPRFDASVDEDTGYRTETVLCVPITTARDEVIGVAQMLNKKEILAAITTQCAVTLQSLQAIERMQAMRQQEMEFLDVVSDMTAELDLKTLLEKVMSEACRMLEAERATLFMHDRKSAELFSHVGSGLDAFEIRIPENAGIAGAVFQSGETVNIPHAYADLRFNPATDKQTGFFTRNMICVPVVNKQGSTIGVTQVLNKAGGDFTDEDVSRLKAFTGQIAIGLENAKLFDDVQSMKNYNEAMLHSMSNGVITFDEDGIIRTCNTAGERILRDSADTMIGQPAADYFTDANAWLGEKVMHARNTGEGDVIMDAPLQFGGKEVSANITILPLTSGEGAAIGTLVMAEDISNEKRVKSTLSRYMDPALTERLLADNAQDEFLGGKAMEATVLFSDLRSFTTISESVGATGTVQLLNDYFTIMVDCLTQQGGMLDKFIGDAIMAVFGIPLPQEDDADRAMRASINMLRELEIWNLEREKAGQLRLDMGIGLNTGQVVSGNIGSPKRMDYTVIGDGVNLASRLESACKQYGADLLISEFTAAKLRGIYRMRELDRVIVKGKTQPVAIYEVLDHHDSATFPNAMDVIGHFKDGIAGFQAGNFDTAKVAFTRALAANPADFPSQMYKDRCQTLLDTPPQGDWDGIWRMTDK
ncbi:MAG: GAF domain-containing protein [Alphaproteobacteria bacterium]